jgi:hypothetical protein
MEIMNWREEGKEWRNKTDYTTFTAISLYLGNIRLIYTRIWKIMI